jgi:tetratricopeptide (TPR) repeat protein
MSLKLFYCYAREDKLLRDALGVHLGNLKRQELIIDWHDRNINAGQEWAREIDTNLNEADIILLLISPDFVHSNYCYSIEMTRALERHENGTARVIPIILRHGDYEGAPFSKLQALPTDAVPVIDRKWRTRDEALVNVVKGIRKIVGELLCNDWLVMGNEYFLREQYREALNAFEQATFFNPDNSLAYVGKGQTLNKLASNNFSGENHEKALAAFTRAIEIDPLNADAYVGKGNTLYVIDWTNDEKELILDIYAQALRLSSNNEEAYIAQGNALLSYENYEDALVSYERAISVAVISNRDVYKSKGDVLFQLKRYNDAVEAYNVCIKAGLRNEEVYTNIGRAFFNLIKYEEALDMYEKALSLNAKSGRIYLEKGNTLFQLNRYQEAIDAYEKAATLISKNAKSPLAQAYRGKGNTWQLLAQEAFKRADELEPPKEEEFDVLADLDDHPF